MQMLSLNTTKPISRPVKSNSPLELLGDILADEEFCEIGMDDVDEILLGAGYDVHRVTDRTRFSKRRV